MVWFTFREKKKPSLQVFIHVQFLSQHLTMQEAKRCPLFPDWPWTPDPSGLSFPCVQITHMCHWSGIVIFIFLFQSSTFFLFYLFSITQSYIHFCVSIFYITIQSTDQLHKQYGAKERTPEKEAAMWHRIEFKHGQTRLGIYRSLQVGGYSGEEKGTWDRITPGRVSWRPLLLCFLPWVLVTHVCSWRKKVSDGVAV